MRSQAILTGKLSIIFILYKKEDKVCLIRKVFLKRPSSNQAKFKKKTNSVSLHSEINLCQILLYYVSCQNYEIKEIISKGTKFAGAVYKELTLFAYLKD